MVGMIKGGNGNDLLIGTAGDDVLRGGPGKDVLDGGAGADTADYGDKTAAVVVRLRGATSAVVAVEGVSEDTIRNIENVTGGTGRDRLIGDALANVLGGGAGADVLEGEAGNDVLKGGAGADTLDGGVGTDTADYSDKTLAVSVVLSQWDRATVKVNGVAEDTIINIENVTGGSGNDSLTGSSEANVLNGGAGNDILSGSIGGDTLDGGAGMDTVDYSDWWTAVVVTLNGATNAAAKIAGISTDTIRNIENVIGGTGDDALTGDDLANRLTGGDGDDVLSGGRGNDSLAGGNDDDVLAGGDGDDVLTGDDGASGWGGDDVLSGGAGDDVLSGGAGEDVLTGEDGDDVLWGGDGSDALSGGNGDDVLRVGFYGSVLDGGAGADTADFGDMTGALVATLSAGNAVVNIDVGIYSSERRITNVENVTGGSGGDRITGDDGANRLNGGGGDDVLRGGRGKDLLDGGAGVDTADYADQTAAIAVTLNGKTNAVVKIGGVAEDTIRNVENLIGGSGNDALLGDGSANSLDGGAGDDVLRGGSGRDVLIGGAGVDTADYSDKTAAIALTYDGSAYAVTVGGVVEDTYRELENVIGGSGNDTLDGSYLFYFDGIDNVLSGRAGNDRLLGGYGDDVLQGGAGKDVLDGGYGLDTADYSDRTSAVGVTLSTEAEAVVTVGGVAEDEVSGIENVIGGSGNDRLKGNELANTLSGGSGDDRLYGVAGDDVLRGGLGQDVLDGGAGVDVADYGDRTGAVAVTLGGATGAVVTVGSVAEDTVRNVENLSGGAGNDTLTGDGLANTLIGGAGKDVLDGGAGLDTADYGDKTTAVAVTLSRAAYASVTVSGFAEDAIRNIENVTGGSGNDRLVGDDLANVLRGSAGNDVLKGGRGEDVLDGGDGWDTADYRDSTEAIAVVLDSNYVAVGGFFEDAIRGVEKVIGSAYADTLTGGFGDDTLTGGGGRDVLDGGRGADTADYSDKTASVAVTLNDGTTVTVKVGGVTEDKIHGIENLIGGQGDDRLTGDRAANVLSGGRGKDVLDGAGGADTVDFGDKTAAVVATLAGATTAVVKVGGIVEDRIRNFENLIGGQGDDRLTGDGLANSLTGGGGADVLIGGEGVDRLSGGDGNDVLQGGLGQDVLEGGAGADTADYSEKTTAVTATLNGAMNVVVTIGGAADDTIHDIENVTGGAGNDKLTGDGLANVLSGGAGNDLLQGGLGKDALDGGAGVDTADFGDRVAGIKVTLNGATKAVVTVGGVAEDTVRNIENVIGTIGDDWLTGDGQANVLSSGGGRDVLDGGGGVDTADYSQAYGVRLTLNGAQTSAVRVAGLNGGTIRNIENVIGGAYDDILSGDAQVNALLGGDGDDVLKGGLGKDVLDGGIGREDTADFSDKTAAVVLSLKGAASATATVGGVGEDTVRNIENVIGGAGNDRLTGYLIGEYSGSNLSGGGGDDLLQGGGGLDHLDGGAGNDTLYGGAGRLHDSSEFGDELRGGAGDDVLKGGDGVDYLYGGDGVDTVDLSDKTLSVQVNLTQAYSAPGGAFSYVVIIGPSGQSVEDRIFFDTTYDPDTRYVGTDVENLIGGSGNDILTTSKGANRLNGGAGNDILDSGAGDDTLDGGAGNDVLFGGWGADRIAGGAGVDTADYSNETAAVVVALDGTRSVVVRVGGNAEDTLSNIERLIGGAGNDAFTGDGLANDLSGGAGDDMLSGGLGNDSLSGGNGDDTLKGGDGRDSLEGGAGVDIADYGDETTSVAVTLNRGNSAVVKVGAIVEDTLRNIENLLGGTGNDRFVGDSLANSLFGGNGNDTLRGGGGEDLLRGGLGRDALDGNDGMDTADYSDRMGAVAATLNGANSAVVKVGGIAEDTLRNIENLKGGAGSDTLTGDGLANGLSGGGGNDVLSGGLRNDTLSGNDGNDVLKGGNGDDTLDGGAGVDSADYSDKTAAVVVTLDQAENAVVTVGGKAEDTIRSIEKVIGGTGNDTLTGDAAVNTLIGGNGDDVLWGSWGSDVLDGGAGNDVLNGGDIFDGIMDGGYEVLNGGVGNDVLHGSGGRDVLNGGAGNDVLDGGEGLDVLTGGKEADTFYFGNDRYGWTDLVADFKIAEGDRLSLVGALQGFDPTRSAITDFVQIVSVGKDSLLMVDYNGKASGSSFDWEAAKIEGVTGLTDERALWLSGNLLV